MRKYNSNYSILLILFLSLLGTAFVPTSSPQSTTSANIRITHPENKSHVNQFGENIEFRSNSAISSSYVPVVFIKDPLNQWWPWLQSKPVDENKVQWRLNNIQFGSAADRDLEFQIQVLVIPRKDLDNGIVLGEGNKLFIEAGEPIRNSIFVTVLKNQYPTQSDVVSVVRR